MKKYGNFTLGGIQQKIFNLVLYVIILMMAAYSAVMLYQYGNMESLVKETNEKQKQSILQISQETMDQVASSGLTSTARLEAAIADDLFTALKGNVEMLADYAEKILADPDAFSPHPVAKPDPSTEGTATTQLLTEEGVDPTAPGIAEKVALMGNMSDMMEALFSTSQISDCYFALSEGVMLLADDHASNKYNEDGSLKTFAMRQRSWYTGAASGGKLYFSDVEADVLTGKVCIMCSMPVYQNGKLAGVAGADLFLDSMAEAVASSKENGGFLFIVNQNGHVIFSPAEDGAFQVRLNTEAQDLRAVGNDALTSLISQSLNGKSGIHLVEADGVNYYMAGTQVETTGWAVISAVDKAAVDMPATMMEQSYGQIMDSAMNSVTSSLAAGKRTLIVLMAAAFVLAVVGALVLSRRIVKPLNKMTSRILSLGGDDLQFRMEKDYETGDEIQALAESFSTLSSRTLEYMNQIQTITAEKERINAELSMATAIQSSQLPRLFPAFPTRSEFDLYASMKPAKEVGGDFYDFFLVDNDHIAMVMADVSGKGVPAALFMMVSRVLIKSHIQNGESPADALANVNDQLCDSNEAGFFVTVWLAVMEISTGKGLAVNAGHEHPAIRHRGGSYELSIYRHSPAVALMNGMAFKEHEFQLNPGDSLFVYTDGVAEATDAHNELFGTDRMLTALNKNPDAEPEQVLKTVSEEINAFVGDAQQFDDITMLCLTYKGRSKKEAGIGINPSAEGSPGSVQRTDPS